MIGRVIGEQYRIRRLVERGGMGVVYEAENPRLTKIRWAVKIMLQSVAETQPSYKRFRREAEILSDLNHPNIVRIFDFARTTEGFPYLAMEMLEGEDLGRRVESTEGVDPGELIPILRQMGRGLQHAHDRTIVHRDLKPKNIFLAHPRGRGLRVKLLDFGISKYQEADTDVTKRQLIIGTPAYMSPEQARGKITGIDHRSDVFSLASLVTYCLTGKAPFEGESNVDTLHMVCDAEPPRVVEQLPDLSPEVDRVLRRGFRKDPAERYPRVDQFISDLIQAISLTHRAVDQPPPDVKVTRQIRAADLFGPAPKRVAPVEASTPPPEPEHADPTAAIDLQTDVVAVDQLFVPTARPEPADAVPPPTPAEPAVDGWPASPAPDTVEVSLDDVIEAYRQPTAPPRIPLPGLSSDPTPQDNRHHAGPPALPTPDASPPLHQGQNTDNYIKLNNISPESAVPDDLENRSHWDPSAMSEPGLEQLPSSTDAGPFDADADDVEDTDLVRTRAVETPTPTDGAARLWPEFLPMPLVRCIGGRDGGWSSPNREPLDWNGLVRLLSESSPDPQTRWVGVAQEPLRDIWPEHAGAPPTRGQLDAGDAALVLGDLLGRMLVRSEAPPIALAETWLDRLFPETERRWALHKRPDLELAVRLPPLLGCVGRDQLGWALARVFGAESVGVREDRSSPSGASLCAQVAPRPDAVETPTTMPMVIGHWFVATPTVVISLCKIDEQRINNMGFHSRVAAHNRDRTKDAATLARCIAEEYLPPHVRIDV